MKGGTMALLLLNAMFAAKADIDAQCKLIEAGRADINRFYHYANVELLESSFDAIRSALTPPGNIDHCIDLFRCCSIVFV